MMAVNLIMRTMPAAMGDKLAHGRATRSAQKTRSGLIAWIGRLISLAILAVIFGSGAVAQVSAPPPPKHNFVDGNSVDLMSGYFTSSQTIMSIGSDDAGINFSQIFIGASSINNLTGTINLEGGAVYKASLGLSSEQLYAAAPNQTTPNGQGATLTYDDLGYTYVMRDGTVVYYLKALSSLYPSKADRGRVSKITRPTGEEITFNYYAYNLCIPSGQGCTNVPAHGLLSVVSSFGYQVRYPWESTPTAVNMAVDICDPTGSCNPTQPVTPFEGQQTYTSTGQSNLVVHRPSGATLTYTRDSMLRVTSVTNGQATWTYTYSDAGDTRTTTATDPLGHTRVLTSSIASAWVLSDTDGAGHTTTFHYGTFGRVDVVTAPEGNKAQYTYDARGNVTELRKVSKTPGTPADIVILAGYDAICLNPKTCNKPNWVRDARSNQTDYVYDGDHGGVLSITSPAANGVRAQTRYSYTQLPSYAKNNAGTLVQIGSIWRLTGVSTCATLSTCVGGGDEIKTTISYAGSNNLLPTSTTNGSGDGVLAATTSSSYDSVGNVVSVDGPLAGSGDTTRYRYDASRRKTGTVSPAFTNDQGQVRYRAVRNTYRNDGLITQTDNGVVLSQSDGDWAQFASLESEAIDYDLLGRPVATRMTADGVTYARKQFSYDAAGRIDCSAVRMNPASASPPAACVIDDPTDRISKFAYDNADRVLKVTSGYLSSAKRDEETSYTANGKVETVTDGNGNRSTYAYDGFDRLERLYFPVAAVNARTSNTGDYEAYGYDPDGNMTSRRLRDGMTVTTTFNARGHGISKNLPATTYLYDNLGRPKSATSAGQSVSWTYDALGRKTTETGSLGVVTREYDLAGRRTQLTWPGGFYVNYDYDLTGAMTAVRENGVVSGPGVLATFNYNNLGERTKLVRGNGATTNSTLDPASRTTSFAHDLAGVANYQVQGFAYNAANQMVSRTDSSAVFVNAPVNSNRAYAVNGRNQLTMSGATELHYDDMRGNLTSDGFTTYGYDIDNNLISASSLGLNATLSYDPAGRLAQTTGSTMVRYLYDEDDLIGEYDSSGTIIRRYAHGSADDEPLVWYEGAGTGDRRWLVADSIGSIVAVTNGASAVIAVNTYDEYGLPGAGNIGRFQFTGQIWLPDLGVYHYKARIYSPTLGRFFQTDPIMYEAGLNWYAYVDNDPVNRTDPSGLCDICVGEVIVTYDNSFWKAVAQYDNWKQDHPYLNFAADVLPGVGTVKAVVDFGLHPSLGNGAMVLVSFIPGAKFGAKLGLKLGERLGARVALRTLKSACFTAGTLVETQAGPRPIEGIKVGDLVLSRDDATGETAYKPVTALLPSPGQAIYRLTLEIERPDGAMTREVFETTSQHPWRTTAQQWRSTVDLQPGTFLVRAEGAPAKVVSVVATGKIEPTYNLEVADFHTYFVGKNKTWVHNSCRWAAGSLETVERSIAVHFEKHGAEVGATSAEQYVRKAEAFADNLKGATKRAVDGYTEGVTRYSKNGRYVDLDLDRRIVSFGTTK